MRNLQTTRTGRRLPLTADFASRFENFFNDFEKEFFGNNERALAQRDSDMFAEFSPAVDIEEANGMYLISADLPGMKKEDIKIDITDRRLKISGERRHEVKDEDNSYIERSQGRFVRTFTLPQAVDPKKIEAHFEDGVLRVVLPKTEAAAPQEVKIESGSTKGLLDRFLHREKNVEQEMPTDKSKHN
jgi:HSP20 family protein